MGSGHMAHLFLHVYATCHYPGLLCGSMSAWTENGTDCDLTIHVPTCLPIWTPLDHALPVPSYPCFFLYTMHYLLYGSILLLDVSLAMGCQTEPGLLCHHLMPTCSISLHPGSLPGIACLVPSAFDSAALDSML